jgi:hypothetical protein
MIRAAEKIAVRFIRFSVLDTAKATLAFRVRSEEFLSAIHQTGRFRAVMSRVLNGQIGKRDEAGRSDRQSEKE